MAEKKTNAARMLDKLGISYGIMYYECEEFVSGNEIAEKLHLPYEAVFKTLAAKGASGKVCVFVIPVRAELDLKAAARAAGEKSVSMLHEKELLPTTGYIRGGCSPLGMKKDYPVYIDDSARLLDKMYVSAGKRGAQLRLTPLDLAKASGAVFACIAENGQR